MYPPVAQSVEQLPFKEMVVGSIPTGRTLQKGASAPFFNVRPSKQTTLLAGRKRKGSPIFLSFY